MPRRWLIAAAAIVLLVAAGLAARPVRNAYHRRQVCNDVHANQAAASGTFGTGTAALVLGDSWASGYRLPAPSQSWARDLATREHWRVTVDAEIGTGYVQRSACGSGTFADRLHREAVGKSKVVVEGGINDATPSGAARVGRAARELLADVHAQAPAARLVVVGVPDVPGRDARYRAEVNTALRAAAGRARGQFIAAAGWRLHLLPDRLHLASVGEHARFAAMVGQDLSS